jgi:molecular chaperone GrpE (heat shock protein)
MLKKCAILGLAVLLVGGLALGWLFNETRSERQRASDLKAKHSLGPEEQLNKYGRWYLLSPEEQNQLALEMNKDRQTKSRQQLVQEQQARLQTDLEMLAAGEMNSGEIADFLYGTGWEQQVREYKKRQEQKEIAHTASVVCISIGGTIFGGCIVIWLLSGLVRIARRLAAWRSRRAGNAQVPELTEIHAQAPANGSPMTPIAGPAHPAQRPEGHTDPWCERPAQSGYVPAEEGFLPRTLGLRPAYRRPTLTARKVIVEEDPMDVLMSDGPTSQIWSPEMQWSTTVVPEVPYEDVTEAPQFSQQPAVATLAPEGHASELTSSLKEQAEDLQKQLAEFKEEVAQSVKQATQERSEPISSTLKELTQQVAAIRDYAASQQDRVEKLQDGYDWGIIRTFCLRVIRCIDNVERRIADLGEDDEATGHLEEVRDELLFALESSGVERYEPQINSDYRGQEKLAEAVKAKQPSHKSEQAGRIAKVLRSGYRYIIDDENVKVVRTAQVKLFG